VGGGWYRFWLAVDLSAYWDPSTHQFYAYVYPRVSQPSVAAGCHIWGVQVAMGSLTAPAYLRTWGAVGARASGPRVSMQSNYIAYSETFAPTYWAKACAVGCAPPQASSAGAVPP